MSDNPYRIEQSDIVKERLKALRAKFGIMAESKLAPLLPSQKDGKPMTEDNVRKLLIKAHFFGKRNYSISTIRKLHIALNKLGIENDKYKDVLQGLKQE
jgi:hypothetical protein